MGQLCNTDTFFVTISFIDSYADSKCFCHTDTNTFSHSFTDSIFKQ